MLDFASLQQQINEMVLDQQTERHRYAEKLAMAHTLLNGWSDQWQDLVRKLEKSRTSWLLAAEIQEPIAQTHRLPVCAETMSVLATDGSQIFPDRHGLSPCHLLNIGKIALHYGTGERPLLTSRPLLFYKDQDTYRDWNGRRIPVNSEVISFLRGSLEIQELALLAEMAGQERRQAVGLTDGTLILWNLEGKPADFQRDILNFYLTSFEQMRQWHVPFMGYISRPTSADVVNVLRVARCLEAGAALFDDFVTNCDKCPFKDSDEELPCALIAGVTDAIMFDAILKDGERTSVFKSTSAILKEYGPHEIYFFYLNVGPEIVRVEIPKWVARDAAFLDLAHGTAYTQAQKGQGYPVSLAEAHEQAVIRGNEREYFYRILENLYVREGLPVSLSRKSVKKRNVTI